MGCTSGAVKCCLNILNTINAIFGIIFLVFATLLIDQSPKSYTVYLYVIGSIMFVSALIGCCGICQEHSCLTTTYAVIILTLLIIQLLGQFFNIDSDTLKKFVDDDINKVWNKELQEPGAMNVTQQLYHCCGHDGPRDYLIIGRPSIPVSCYPEQIVNQTTVYETGCLKAAEDKFMNIFNYSVGGTWGGLAFTAIVCVLAFFLAARFRNKTRRYDY